MQTQLKDKLKDSTLEHFKHHLYVEELINSSLEQLEYSNNFFEIDFVEKLNDNLKNHLKNISDFE